MKLISLLLKHIVYPGLSRSGYLRRSSGPGPVVVTYHGIVPRGYRVCDPMLDGNLVTAQNFVRQICLLKSKYTVISPQQFLHWGEDEVELPSRAVLLTCDDGLLNNLTDMLPLALELDVQLLFFVTGASALPASSMLWYEQLYLWLQLAVGNIVLRVPWREHPVRVCEQIQALRFELIKNLSALDAASRHQLLADLRTQIGISQNWDSEYSENTVLRRRFLMLNVNELRQLANAGMTIGAHTISHPMLSQMSDNQAFEEISQSRDQLEGALSRPVWALAFPFGNPGAVSSREIEFARRAGFKFAFMNVESRFGDYRFAVPRVHASLGMNLAEFEAHVSGVYQRMRSKYLRAGAGAIA